MNHETWSKSEKAVARRAFDLAYERETRAIMEEVRKAAAALKEPADLWQLSEFLREKHRETARKYDYRYSVLISLFAGLMRQGWLKPEDLAGLSADKLDRITGIAKLK